MRRRNGSLRSGRRIGTSAATPDLTRRDPLIERKSAWQTLLPIGLVALAGCYVFSRRTRRYDSIDPELRSPGWRVRSPSLGPRLLPIARWATRAITPVHDPRAEGVDIECIGLPRADGSTLAIYLYHPHRRRRGGAALMHSHGGGLVMGSAPEHHPRAAAYARDLGALVASVDYRLAPENPYPAALDDIHAAYRWLLSEAGRLGIDPSRIAVGGDSAGGGLTASLCQRILDAGDRAPVLQILVYPMLDDRTGRCGDESIQGQLVWTPASNRFGWMSYLGGQPTGDALPEHAVPARRRDLTGLPPAWIGVGTLDLFHDEDLEYGRRLKAAGVRCEIIAVEGAFHGFDAMFPNTAITRAFRADMVAAFERATHGDA